MVTLDTHVLVRAHAHPGHSPGEDEKTALWPPRKTGEKPPRCQDAKLRRDQDSPIRHRHRRETTSLFRIPGSAPKPHLERRRAPALRHQVPIAPNLGVLGALGG